MEDVKYPVVWHKTDEGVAGGCPGLPGGRSQGATQQEALKNIEIAIAEYLDIANEGSYCTRE